MELIRKIEILTQHIHALLAQVETLKIQESHQKQLNTEANDTIHRLTLASDKHVADMEALQHDLQRLREEHAETARNLSGAVDERMALSKASEEMHAKYQQLLSEIQQLRKNEETQLSLQFGKEKEQELLQAVNEDLKEQLMASQQLNGELQEQLQALRMQNRELESHTAELRSTNESLAQNNNVSAEKYQFELSALHSKISELEEQRAQLFQENKNLLTKIGVLEPQIQEKTEQADALLQELDRQKTQTEENDRAPEIARLQQQTGMLEARISNLLFEKELILKNQSHTPAPVDPPAAQPESAPSGNESDPRLELLYAELHDSRETNRQLEKRISQYIEMMNERSHQAEIMPQEPKNAEEQNKIIKLAQAIEGNSVASNMELKVKLGEMIKEIDRCIAKLSS